MLKLDEIGLSQGTDKASTFHNFLNFYEGYLTEFREQEITLLEIGVKDGASVRMWREFFPRARIIGVDIDVNAKQHANERIVVEIADQGNLEQLSELARKYGPFDVVIDDGSHFWDHQITTLHALFPELKKGGVYILEDIDTSYIAGDEYANGSTETAMDYIKVLLDYIVGDRFLNLKDAPDAFIKTYAHSIQTIAFAKRTSVIVK
jgi:cyclopropane fatty-acyl-phospholipid synthase-like methyltransferase